MRYELFLAHRFFRSRKRTGFVSLITWISVLGVALGVAVLILALSIVNGLSGEFTRRILGTNSAVILLRYDQKFTAADSVAAVVEGVPGVVGAAPFIHGEAGILDGSRFRGLFVKGLDLETTSGVTTIGENITPALKTLETAEGELPAIVVGRDLAHLAHASVGDTLLLANPLLKPSIAGPRARFGKFRVAGIYTSGIYEYDSRLTFMSLAEAQRFFRMGRRITGMDVKIEEPLAVDALKESILRELGGYPYRINTWIDLNRNLFVYMKIEKYVLGLILLLIVLIAAFNIVGALVMVVMEKRREIGILKSMGATDAEILRLFMSSGAEIGVLGIAIGSVVGVVGALLLARHRIPIPNDVYILDTVPVDLQALDVIVVCLAAFLVCWLATLYPAWKAARLDPVAAIREG